MLFLVERINPDGVPVLVAVRGSVGEAVQVVEHEAIRYAERLTREIGRPPPAFELGMIIWPYFPGHRPVMTKVYIDHGADKYHFEAEETPVTAGEHIRDEELARLVRK